ncbi:hypothetical protein [Alistipes sp.]|uniref:hypothetical protein n=1 Tax=Alistipes sp. TaxID=1872444 RepID=UPI003529368A
MKYILLYLWQLPQNLLGLLLFHVRVYKPLREIEFRGHRVLICDMFPGGISLGNYILVDFHREAWDAGRQEYVRMELRYSIRHEFGHSRQSEYLGWLYLPVVGLFSGVHNLCHRFGCARGNYYRYWCEAWANRLGGIPKYGL